MSVSQGGYLGLDLFDLAGVEVDGAFGLGAQPVILDLKEPGFLCSALRNHVVPCGQERGKALEVGRSGRICCWGVCCAKVSQHPGIELISFGENAPGAGKVADLARVDDAYGNLLVVEKSNELVLVAAGGLTDHMDLVSLEPFGAGEELGKAAGVVGDGESLIKQTAINGRFGHIGAEINRRRRHEKKKERRSWVWLSLVITSSGAL